MKLIVCISNRSLIASINKACQVFCYSGRPSYKFRARSCLINRHRKLIWVRMAAQRNWQRSTSLRQELLFVKRISGEGRGLLCADEVSSKLQREPDHHSTLDHWDTGTRAKSPEVSRYCIRVFQAAGSGRLLCEQDPQNVHANDLQIP